MSDQENLGQGVSPVLFYSWAIITDNHAQAIWKWSHHFPNCTCLEDGVF
jgi:hypothetical protein